MADYKRIVMEKPCALVSYHIDRTELTRSISRDAISNLVYEGLTGFIQTYWIQQYSSFGDTNHLPQAMFEHAEKY